MHLRVHLIFSLNTHSTSVWQTSSDSIAKSGFKAYKSDRNGIDRCGYRRRTAMDRCTDSMDLNQEGLL